MADDIEGAGFRRLNVPSVVDEVARELRRMILDGTLPPGTRLVEDRLGEELGVSRPPLREAMRILIEDGLITSAPRRGNQVAVLTERDVEEIYEIRWGLEKAAVSKLARHRPADADLGKVRAALEALEKAAARTDESARTDLLDASWDFHRAVCLTAENSRLIDVWDRLTWQLRACMTITWERVEHKFEGGAVAMVGRHRRLMKAIEAGDVDAAIAALVEMESLQAATTVTV